MVTCKNCNQDFERLNEYDLCDDCEQEVQREKKEIEETYDSLNISMR